MDLESNELIQEEIRELVKPPPTYWARLMESVSDVKNEVTGALKRKSSTSSRSRRSYSSSGSPHGAYVNSSDGLESYSSSATLMPPPYESRSLSSYGSICMSSPRGYGNSSMDGSPTNGAQSRSRSRASSHSRSSGGMEDEDLLITDSSQEMIRLIPRSPESLYPIILVNDQYQGSAGPSSPTTPFAPGMASFSKSKMNLNIPPMINNLHSPEFPTAPEEQNFNFLTVEQADGGPSSPSRKSSGFLSGCPSPTPTMNTSFELQSRESNSEPEVFTWGRMFKIGLLMLTLLVIASVITLTSEAQPSFKQITVSKQHPVVYPLYVSQTLIMYHPILTVQLVGAFIPPTYKNFTENRLYVYLQKKNADGEVVEGFGEKYKWEIPIFSEGRIGGVPETKVHNEFNLKELIWDRDDTFSVVFATNSDDFFPLAASGRLLSSVVDSGVIFGGAVVIGLYILIIFELVNRTLAAMLAAAASIGSLAYLNERPTTQEMVSWLDMDTLILLFSMMVMVSLLCETGFFDYAAYIMYKVANGRVWMLITGLCLFTAIVSAFLDNVTTILLMTPVTIRICEAMELNPVPVLISLVLFSNIGGAVTPVGDPPNVIISNNAEVIKGGIEFANFSLHMLLGIIPVTIIAYLQLRLIFRDIKSLKFSEPYEIAELRREIDVWSRAANSLSSYSRDESHVRQLLASKILHLRNKLKVKIRLGGQSEENYKANLAELELSCKIRDWTLLVKCGLVLSVVIIMFFLHSVPQVNLSMGWTALLGTVFLLILADRRELEGIFGRVEWSTLIFFSSLFVVMEGVSRLGLLEWIGGLTESIILNVDEESRLTVAVLLILWVSGIASAFIDNIPFTTMMVQIVTRIADRVDLPLQPLIWALAFGTCLGGNGTLIGASSNVVCAGLADQHGYRFTFMEYFKIGFPMMIVSLMVSTVYLLICHTWLEWNY